MGHHSPAGIRGPAAVRERACTVLPRVICGSGSGV